MAYLNRRREEGVAGGRLRAASGLHIIEARLNVAHRGSSAAQQPGGSRQYHLRRGASLCYIISINGLCENLNAMSENV